jgi:hypothetical protein
MRARLAEPTCFERRRCARWRACVALVLYPAAIAAQPGGRPAAEAVAPVDAAHAFDFVLGLWKVEEQRSTRPLQGLTTGEVEIRQGVASWRPLAGGVGLIEESELEHPNAAPSRGVTLLAYALPARQWTLLEFSAAAGSRSVMGRGLCHGTPGRCAGEFIGSETIDGRVVLAREHIRMWALHAWEWERQISPDGGLHWETLRRRYYSRTGADSAAPPQPGATAVPRPARTTYCCSQMELRRYVASKDRVRVLEELFHDENAVGRSVGIQQRVSSGLGTDSADVDVYWMQNLALLRDVDRPDSYVWLRGHTVMQGNPAPFYLTPTWSLHQEAVGRAGIRSTDAHLLETWTHPAGFLVGAPMTNASAQRGLLVVTVYTVPESKLMQLEGYFTSFVTPLLIATGGRPAASFRSVTGWRYQPHNARAFGPTSPLDVGVFVWFAHFSDAAAHRRHVGALDRDTTWQRRVEPLLREFSTAPVQVWRLEPLPGSRIIY